jgi:hypothetical protein
MGYYQHQLTKAILLGMNKMMKKMGLSKIQIFHQTASANPLHSIQNSLT